MEVRLPAFVAHVELRFEAESLQACAGRLNALTGLLRAEGVELRQARAEPAPPEPSEADGWVRYTPSSAGS